jgi:hypothetical protein
VGVPNAEQTAVWRKVSRKLPTTSSSSDALQDVFRNYERKLEESVEKLPRGVDRGDTRIIQPLYQLEVNTVKFCGPKVRHTMVKRRTDRQLRKPVGSLTRL